MMNDPMELFTAGFALYCSTLVSFCFRDRNSSIPVFSGAHYLAGGNLLFMVISLFGAGI